jgi:anti-anti-sigma factor
MVSRSAVPSLPVDIRGGKAVVRIPGARFDITNSESLSRQLSSLVAELGSRDVTLDFSGVQYLNSDGLAALVMLHKSLRAAGGKLAVSNVQAPVHEVFRVTCLDQMLDVRPSEAAEAP